MMIPVEVQKPNQPDDIAMEEVAKRVGVPDGCLLDGRIRRRKGQRQWLLIADVKFQESDNVVCPHCGGALV
jgi:hypothetical protein